MEETDIGVMEEPAQMNFIQRLTGMFFEPGRTFADINRKPSWFGVYLIVGILSMPFMYLLFSRINMAAQTAQQMADQGVAPEQIEQSVRIMSIIYKYVVPILAPLGILVTYLIIAAVLLLLFIIMGAPLTFKKSLAVTFWGYFPPAIVSMFLSVVILFVKDPSTLDPRNVMMSNLGALADVKANPVLFSLLSSLDLFTIWTIALLSIGFAAISDRRLTTKKAATGIIVLWVIYVLGKAGIAALTGR
jgi:hypothetical protein